MREALDGLVGVVHAERDAVAFEVEDFPLLGFAVFAGEAHLEFAFALDHGVGRAVLVTESVTADHDRRGPVRDEARNVFADDRLTEDRAVEDVTDGAIRALPHLLQVEFFHAGFIRRDGRALDADVVFLNGFGRFDGDLVIGLVTVFHAEVVVLDINIEVRSDELLLDECPDDAGHFIAVEFDDWISNFNFLHGVLLKSESPPIF